MPAPPRKKHPRPTQKRLPSGFHHQCADPRIDPIGKPPSANPVHRTHAKDSHPKLASDRVLTPSRTRISSPPAIAREERRACSNNLPRRNATATRARAMGQDYPLTGPSPGANPPIHPSSLPRASGNLFSVCTRHVNLLVCSLPLHRHSYTGFIFRFHFIDSS